MTKPILIRRELLIEKHDKSYIVTNFKSINGCRFPLYTKYWLDEEGCFHRDNDKPALITKMGSYHWYYHGIRHRENNKPASIYFNGEKEYYKNGIFIKQN